MFDSFLEDSQFIVHRLWDMKRKAFDGYQQEIYFIMTSGIPISLIIAFSTGQDYKRNYFEGNVLWKIEAFLERELEPSSSAVNKFLFSHSLSL